MLETFSHLAGTPETSLLDTLFARTLFNSPESNCKNSTLASVQAPEQGMQNHPAPEAARHPDGTLREGTFNGANGSRIEYARRPDGVVSPRSITYADGSSSQFAFNNQGVCTEVRNYNRQSELISRWNTEDGTSYIVRIGSAQPFPAEQGVLTVRNDGTWRFAGTARTWETSGSGLLSLRYQGTDGPREVRFHSDGTQIQFRTVGGELRPWRALLADRTQITVIFATNNQPRDVLLVLPNHQRITYERQENGDWLERPGNRLGTLTFNDGIAPVFQPRNAEVQEPPRLSDSGSSAEQQRQRTLALQDRLAALVDSLYSPRFAQSSNRILQEALAQVNGDHYRLDLALLHERYRSAHAALQRELDADRQHLQQEAGMIRAATNVTKVWHLCPVTQRLYRELITWLEREAVPAAMRRLAGMHAADIPPGSPLVVPQQDGAYLIPPLFRARVANGQLSQTDLNIQGTRPGDNRPLLPPSSSDIDSLARALIWLLNVQQQMDARRRDYELHVLMPQIISDPRNNLPIGWLNEMGANPESRRAAMTEMIDLAFSVRNYAAAIVALRLDQTAGVSLPPNSHPLIEGSGNQRRLVRLNAQLPETLDMQSPENLRRIEQLREWLRINSARVDEAMRAYAEKMSPQRQIFYGQIETRGRVLCDDNGNPQEILRPDDPRSSQSNAREFNVLDCQYSVRHERDGIYVDYTIQPRQSSWYNYLNIAATNVCQPFSHTRGPLRPTDLLAVRDGSGSTQIIPAAQLDAYLQRQQLMFHGSRALTVTMDIGMLVAGVISGGTTAAAWTAGRIGVGAAIRHGGAAMLRAGLGASGFLLNNAYAHTDSSGQIANDVRSALIVLDVAQGTARQLGGGALRWLNLSRAAQSSTSYARTMEQFVAQSGWILRGLHRVEQATHLTLEIANVGYAPLIFHDLRQQWHAANSSVETPNPFEQAREFLARGTEQFNRSLERRQAVIQHNLQLQARLLDSYRDQLCEGRSQPIQQQIRALFERAHPLLDNPALPQAQRATLQQGRTALSNELLALMYGSSSGLGDLIAQRESRNQALMSDSAVRTLNNEGFAANRDLQTAAAVLFLFLAPRDGQQGIAREQVLGSRRIAVPRHEWYVSSGGQGPGATHVVNERTVVQSITAGDIISILREETARTDCLSRRLIAGDLLIRTGERSVLSYAAIVRDTLRAANATNPERIAAILSLGPILNALHLHAQDRSNQSQLYGVDAADLEQSLRAVAVNEQQPDDIRALAAAVLHVVRENVDPERVESALTTYAQAMVARRSEPGAFARYLREQLADARRSNNISARLGAILALADLGNLADMSDPTAFNTALIGCLDGNQPAICLMALRHMRLTNPQALSAEQRRTVCALLDEQTTVGNSALKLEILENIGSFAVSAEERTNVARFLEAMIDPLASRLYTQDGALRAAAITALARLNVNNEQARRLIVARLNPQHERDPRARLAAIRALEQLMAPGQQASHNLHQIVVEALRTENDAAVRAALLEARVHNLRPIRDQRYIETMQAIQARLEHDFQFDQTAIRNWLINNERYELLNFETYQRRHGNALSESANWYQRHMIGPVWLTGALTQQEIQGRESTAGSRIFGERIAQFQQLARDAAQSNAQGQRARMALLFIAIGSNPPFEDTVVNTFREWAAVQIRYLCQSGSEVRGEFLEGIRLGLLSVSLPIEVRRELLAALIHFVDNCPPGPTQVLERFIANPRTTTTQEVIRAFEAAGLRVPPLVRTALEQYTQNPNRDATAIRQLVETIWQAIDTRSSLYRQMAATMVATSLRELDSSGWQIPRAGQSGFEATEQYHRQLISLLAQWRYRDVYPVLEATIRSHPYDSIRQLARQTLADMRDRIDPIWQRTQLDTDTPPTQRAQNIESLLLNGDSDDLVQALFSGARGRPIEAQSDPRINLYLRALRDGGNFRPPPQETHAIDGAEKVRLAAAMVVLERNSGGELVNPGFSQDDRRAALQIVLTTALQGSQFGYVQDATAMLVREVAANDNCLLLTVLGDHLLANPNDSRTVRINEESRTVRSLIEHNFRCQPGAATKSEISTGRGILVQHAETGRLIAMTETFSNSATTIVMRRANDALIVEEFRNGAIARTSLPPSSSYASVLLWDMTHQSSVTERMNAARRLLTAPNTGATAADRASCLNLLHSAACSGEDADRLRFAQYLTAGDWLSSATNTERHWREQGLIAIHTLAMRASQPLRDQARDLVRQFGSAEACVCMQALHEAMQEDTTRAQQRTSNLNELINSMERIELNPIYLRAYEEYRRAIGPSQGPPVNPSCQPDTVRMARDLLEIASLYEQSGGTNEAQNSFMGAYLVVARWFPVSAPELVHAETYIAAIISAIDFSDVADPRFLSAMSILSISGRAELKEQILERFIVSLVHSPLVENDPRLPHLAALLQTTAAEQLKMQLAEALLGASSVVARAIGLRHIGSNLGSTNNQLRARAIALIEPLRATSELERQIYRHTLQLASVAFTSAQTRNQNGYFWQQFHRFLENNGEDRNSPLFREVQSRMLEFPLPGTGTDSVVRAERLAQEAVEQRNPIRARTFMEEALEARAERDGEHNLELARARLWFVRFLEAIADDSPDNRIDDQAIIRQLELAAEAFRQQSPRLLEEADVLRQLASAYQLYREGEQDAGAQMEGALQEAASVYQAHAQTRDNVAYAQCLHDLISARLRSGNRAEAERSLQQLLDLVQLPISQSGRARVLTHSWQAIVELFNHAERPEQMVSTAIQLLPRLFKLNLRTIQREHTDALWTALWWMGRSLNESERTQQSYRFFEAALDVFEATRGRNDYEWPNLLSYYARLLDLNHKPHRAREVLARVN